MFYAFVFDSIAVSVRYCEVPIGDDVEAGTRVEVWRAETMTGRPGRPYDEGVWLSSVSEGDIWRADLLVVMDPPTGEDRNHYHTHPRGPRLLSPELSADPVGWTERKLADLRTVLLECEAADLVDAVDYDEVRGVLPAIRAAIEACQSRRPAPVVEASPGIR